MWTGLKKCMPTTRSGLRAPAAISVIESEEVLVAKMKAVRARLSTSRSVSRFRSNTSGAASIKRSRRQSPVGESSRVCAEASGRAPLLSPWRARCLWRGCVRWRATPRASASRHVAQDNAIARGGGGLRDTVPHRARAEHGDSLKRA